MAEGGEEEVSKTHFKIEMEIITNLLQQVDVAEKEQGHLIEGMTSLTQDAILVMNFDIIHGRAKVTLKMM